MEVGEAMNDERLFTVQQTAEKLGYYVQSVYRLIYAGRLRAVRLGRNRGRIRVPESAINEILEPRPVIPTSPKRRKK